jgi:hypothetical protein
MEGGGSMSRTEEKRIDGKQTKVLRKMMMSTRVEREEQMGRKKEGGKGKKEAEEEREEIRRERERGQ